MKNTKRDKSENKKINTVEFLGNSTKAQIADLENKIRANSIMITHELSNLQKDLLEFKSCVKTCKRHLVNTILLITVSIVVIYILHFFF